jgi:hypothetical protein
MLCFEWSFTLSLEVLAACPTVPSGTLSEDAVPLPTFKPSNVQRSNFI